MTAVANDIAKPMLTSRETEGACPFEAPDALPQESFAAIRRRAVLEFCKWDPQVGDTGTLAPFPLIVSRDTWRQLASWSERLAAEAVAAEEELITRPELHRSLGLPRAVRRALAEIDRLGATPCPARVMRFDFHWAAEGWRISEVNADVPGGFTESSAFTAMMAEHFADAEPAGDPAAHVVDALAERTPSGGFIALLTAPGYMEDFQIVSFLAARFAAHGFETVVDSPAQLRWRDGRATLNDRPIDTLYRFFQGEWLPQLPRASGWRHFFRGGRTPAANPGSAVLIETKRFPLVWNQLRTALPTWRELLPETRDPRDAPWRRDESWILKSAMSNNGDAVGLHGCVDSKNWRTMKRDAWWRPGSWVAQRRFHALPVSTPRGDVYPCLGVYTVNGHAAGIYGRIAPRPLIDFAAIDVAVLVRREGAPT